MIRLESWQVEVNVECSTKDLDAYLKSLCPVALLTRLNRTRDPVGRRA